MKQRLAALKDWLFWLRGFLPLSLPVGAQEFESYCTRLFRVYQLPDDPSYRNAVATMILQQGPTSFRKAPYFFALCVRMAQAKQTAFQITDDYRAHQRELVAKARAAEAAEAAAQSQPNGEATPATEPPIAEETKAP